MKQIGVPEAQPFVPDPFQIEALETLQYSDVLVTAPTGAGKTYIAIQAIGQMFGKGGKSWYASPLKALSNAKFEEFSTLFGAENVGILTGDRKENTQAPIIVGTTEILRNQLYDTMHRGEDLEVDLVVLDEAHYLGDKDRGVVWEEVLIYLPSRVKVLLLSATIRNADEICNWLEWLRQSPCRWVSAQERPVPLFPLFLFPSGELTPLSTRRGMFAKIRTVDPRSFPRRDLPDIPQLLDVLRKANLLPAIFFLKSRADCEKAIMFCPASPRSKNGRDPSVFRSRVNELLKTYPFLREHRHLSILKRARVGAHHGGQLPHWKLFLEKLMQEGHLDAIFSTSTVAAGVNFPARTVVILQSDRFNGREFTELSATDLLQMTGRAGRRGMDEIGFVMVVPGPYQDPQLIHELLRSPPDSIESQIRVNFSMALNLLLSHLPEEIRTLFADSFATYQNLSREGKIAEEFRSIREEIGEWASEMTCESLEKLTHIRPQYIHLKEQLKKMRRAWKREATSLSSYGLITPGRLFRNRKGTLYMAVGSPQAEQETVEAVRLALPVRFRKKYVQTHWVPLHRIRDLGEKVEEIPDLKDREKWEELAAHLNEEPFRPLSQESIREESPGLEMTTQNLAALTLQKASLPCEGCALYGPCQKTMNHPFSVLIQRYLDHSSQLETVQERLWISFLHHYRFLQKGGYVNEEGKLTEDGLWAAKLRLDQPLLISETIRQGVLPSDNPGLLAALIAPFVMDRERAGDERTSSNLIWKYPDLAKSYFKMVQHLQPLQEDLRAAGFFIPPLPFWTMITVYHWAQGDSWETVRELSGMDDGDLAMVILRTADHLRQIESLYETHPRLAASARKGIELILREPVLVE